VSGEDATPATPAIRASDADRERTATLLREHCADGRLTPEELSERLDTAYAARTVGELDALLHDLPAPERPAPPASPTRERARRRVQHALGLMVLVNLTCLVVWLATGAEADFWPKWVLLATAIRLAFLAWGELGPAADDEARLGRGGARRVERAELHSQALAARAEARGERARRRAERR
jgi:uncharacterized protein DUF1707